MSLSRLPPELLIIIAYNITDSEGKCQYGDLNSLVQVNRAHYVCLNTILWKQALESKHKTERIFQRFLIWPDTKNLARLRFFLELGANIETPMPKGYSERFFHTPLWVAVRRDNVPMARVLLEKGANVRNHSNSSSPQARARRRSIMHAAQSAEMVQLLLDHGADLEEKNEFGETPLWTYTRRNDIAAMRVVLQAGAEVDPVRSVDVRPSGGARELTILHHSMWCSVEAIKILLEFGADLKEEVGNSHNSWHSAAMMGNTAVLRFLMEHWPEGIRAKTGDGDTPLHLAAWKRNKKAVRLLVELWPEAKGEFNVYHETPLTTFYRCQPWPLQEIKDEGEIYSLLS
jgi:hypothetical protein